MRPICVLMQNSKGIFSGKDEESNLDPLLDLEPEKLFTFEKTMTGLTADEAISFGIRRSVFLLFWNTRCVRRG